MNHISHSKQFGDSPSVNVIVCDKRDNVSNRNGVLVNWSTVGAVTILEAEEFRDDLEAALRYARIQRKALPRT